MRYASQEGWVVAVAGGGYEGLAGVGSVRCDDERPNDCVRDEVHDNTA